MTKFPTILRLPSAGMSQSGSNINSPTLKGNILPLYSSETSVYLNPLFVQLMHTQNYSKIVELLKSFKTTVISRTCFGLHKPSSGSSQSVLRQSYNIDFSVSSLMMVYVSRNMLEQLL